LLDGKHLDLGREHVRINPLLELEDEGDLTWAAQWIESLIASKGYRVTSEDTKYIWLAVEGVSKLPVGTRKLASIAFQLPRHLVAELDPWINDGPLASFFDHKEDEFTLSDHTTMEMGEIMQQPAAARAFLDYAFHRIQKLLDGRPTLIYIEEAWFMLEDEHFVRRLNNWLRTLAKRNAIIGMATQSLMELSNSSIFSVIVDSIPTKIYLPNKDALQQRHLYRDKLGLNEGQIDLIAGAIQKRDYILINRNTTRVLESVFTPAAMAVIRSDIKAQEVFTRHMNSSHPQWKENYYAEIIN
jgi:type IV secretion system protein VirB4